MGKPLKIEIGTRFGNLTAVQEIGRNKSGQITWLFKCDCGLEKIRAVADIKRYKNDRCDKKCSIKPFLIKSESILCSKCKNIYPFNDRYFPKRSRRQWGMDTICRKCVNEKARILNLQERQRLKLEILTHYSPNGILGCSCVGCDIKQIEFLTLDHIHGKGKEERKKFPATGLFRYLRKKNFPTGYRTLCWNCNASLGIFGYCPHQGKTISD